MQMNYPWEENAVATMGFFGNALVLAERATDIRICGKIRHYPVHRSLLAVRHKDRR